ncbi:MAG TPA: GDSL-type esterase/lipase family protein [Spongiibacteraceae bacterium]|jgi:lysophospholipase L1-like esterase
MQTKFLVVSVVLNVIFLILIIGGLFTLPGYALSLARIMAERSRTQFDFLTDKKDGIVFLGDSITQGGNWSEIFNNGSILNRGIGGDTTQDILDRINQIYLIKPVKIFLMVGVNDLNQKTPLQTMFINYKKLFDGFDESLPRTKIYVQSILPIYKKWILLKANNSDIKLANNFLREECKKRGYTFIDLNTAFLDGDGMLQRDLSNDGIHLLGAGYKLWRDEIKAQVIE